MNRAQLSGKFVGRRNTSLCCRGVPRGADELGLPQSRTPRRPCTRIPQRCVMQDVVGGAVGNDLTVIDDNDPVAAPQRQVDVMG